jgi:transcriptional regulator with XRE-family HTH domain
VNNAQELKALLLSLLKMQGKKPSRMIADLGFGSSFIAELGSKRGFPSIDRMGKLASYLNVSVDYLFGIYDQGKTSNDVALELCLAMPKEDRKAILKSMLALSGESDSQKAAAPPKGYVDLKMFQSMLDAFKGNLGASLEELDSGLNDIGEKLSSLESLASATDQRERVMVQFLALPIHLKKIFLQEAVERTIDSES